MTNRQQKSCENLWWSCQSNFRFACLFAVSRSPCGGCVECKESPHQGRRAGANTAPSSRLGTGIGRIRLVFRLRRCYRRRRPVPGRGIRASFGSIEPSFFSADVSRECSLTSPSKAVSGNFRCYNPISMKELAENIWVLPYSLRLFGADLRRIVTVVRLRSGELIIHSTGPFTPGESQRP
jgi:hypothetical protein